jgi:hypothetical protein
MADAARSPPPDGPTLTGCFGCDFGVPLEGARHVEPADGGLEYTYPCRRATIERVVPEREEDSDAPF